MRDRDTLCQPQSHRLRLVRIAMRAPKGSTDCKSALAGGDFVDAVPKARPEYSEGHAHIYLLFRVLRFAFRVLGFWVFGEMKNRR